MSLGKQTKGFLQKAYVFPTGVAIDGAAAGRRAGTDALELHVAPCYLPPIGTLMVDAMHLKQLMAAIDTAALMQEFAVAIEARYESANRGAVTCERYMQANREAFVMERALLNFGPEEVVLRRWADGRVWQMRHAGAVHEAFFHRPSGSNEGKLYLAQVDGRLRVVR